MYDEMRDGTGAVRPLWSGLAGVLDGAGAAGLAARRADTLRLLADDGVAYHPPGAESEQLWELDPLPLVLDGAEWAGLERGLAQRAELLDLLLTDLYGPRSVLTAGLLPVEVVDGHPGYLYSWRRPADAPPRRELFLAGVDLGRSPDGWVVLDDRVQAPSGAGYAMANRRVVARVLSALHRRSRIRRLGPFFEAMRAGLHAGGEEQRVVLLNPGPDSETAYEQALLSSLLGVPLVLGSELTVRQGRLWRHSLGTREPVDVVLRRLDAEWCDPLDLRPDSRLGIPGLVEAARTGTVTVLNGLGAGVAENPGLVPFLPGLCRALLGEELLLAGTPTWWCGDPVARAHVRARLPELVLTPISRGRRAVRGAELSAAERRALLDRIEAEPHAWTAQEPVPLSTAPVVTDTGLAPRQVALRSFAVHSGTDWVVLDGGLGSVPRVPGVHPLDGVATLAKDVWVVGERPSAPVMPAAVSWRDEPEPAIAPAGVSPRVAEDLFWLGRYSERAEDTARLLRAVTDRWGDFQATPDPAGAGALRTLLLATTEITRTEPGFAGRQPMDLDAAAGELHSLLCDRARPGTLGFAVHRLTRAAQSVRELLSTDTWLVLGRLDAVLSGLAAVGEPDGDQVSRALNRVLEGLLALSGIAAESLVRDAGWRLLDAGRRIERAQHVVALLRATLCAAPRGPADRLVAESVTIAAESVITYRRRHTGRGGLGPLLDLLLADADNPRALAYQLDRLAEDLADLPGTAPEALGAAARRLDALDPAALAARDTADGTRPALRALLDALGADLARLADDIAVAHFAPVPGPRPYDPLVGAA